MKLVALFLAITASVCDAETEKRQSKSADVNLPTADINKRGYFFKSGGLDKPEFFSKYDGMNRDQATMAKFFDTVLDDKGSSSSFLHHRIPSASNFKSAPAKDVSNTQFKQQSKEDVFKDYYQDPPTESTTERNPGRYVEQKPIRPKDPYQNGYDEGLKVANETRKAIVSSNYTGSPYNNCSMPELLALNDSRLVIDDSRNKTGVADVGDTVDLMCKENIAGDAPVVTVECKDDGKWDQELKKCDELPCSLKVLQTKILVKKNDTWILPKPTPNEEVVESGTTVTFACEEGSEWDTKMNKNQFKCRGGGKWDQDTSQVPPANCKGKKTKRSLFYY